MSLLNMAQEADICVQEMESIDPNELEQKGIWSAVAQFTYFVAFIGAAAFFVKLPSLDAGLCGAPIDCAEPCLVDADPDIAGIGVRITRHCSKTELISLAVGSSRNIHSKLVQLHLVRLFT